MEIRRGEEERWSLREKRTKFVTCGGDAPPLRVPDAIMGLGSHFFWCHPPCNIFYLMYFDLLSNACLALLELQGTGLDVRVIQLSSSVFCWSTSNFSLEISPRVFRLGREGEKKREEENRREERVDKRPWIEACSKIRSVHLPSSRASSYFFHFISFFPSAFGPFFPF